MRKSTAGVFAIFVLCVVSFFLWQHFLPKSTDVPIRSRQVVPRPISTNDEYIDELPFDDSNALALEYGETLLGSSSFDFDYDGFDDQINYVKQGATSNITVLVGIYNNITGVYDRKETIQTNIAQVSTFSCTQLDLTGEHKLSLVCQGVSSTGVNVLTAYIAQGQQASFALRKIADISSNGAIFVQTLDRDESYELYRAKGSSFPIYVYDTKDNNDQVQIVYNYDTEKSYYVKTSQTLLSTTKIAQNRLNKILDGSVKSFANFLDGLWYNMAGGNDTRYLFFDYNAKEIIFLTQDAQEVFLWQNSSLRHNGIYLTTINSSVQNLQRRFDITLTDIDEIKLRLQDDVRMFINENSIWDGQYKKMSSSLIKYKDKRQNPLEAFVQILQDEEGYHTLDGNNFLFKKDGHCYVSGNDKDTVTVDYVMFNVGKDVFVEIRPISNDVVSPVYMQGIYSLSYKGSLLNASTEGNDTLILTPVKATPIHITKRDLPTIVLIKGESDSSNQK